MLLSVESLEIIILVALIWLAGLSFLIYNTSSHYDRLVKKTGKEDLKSILESLLDNQTKLNGYLKKVEQKIGDLDQKSQLHIQKTGVVRFNPYQETGGDQSFALALLDGQDNGVVFLSLHSREGTRTYLKPVRSGKSSYELSKEEQQAIVQAIKGK